MLNTFEHIIIDTASIIIILVALLAIMTLLAKDALNSSEEIWDDIEDDIAENYKSDNIEK